MSVLKKKNLGQMVFCDKGFFEPSHMMAAKWRVTMAINANLILYSVQCTYNSL